MKSILIDHDDSFTYNLRHWLKPLSSEVTIVNHRELSSAPDLRADFFILSPGPKKPEDYTDVLHFLGRLSSKTPVFGVCLGLQLMVHSHGGKVQPYSPPLHGKKSKLKVLSEELHLLQGKEVARYHSLYCTDYPAEEFETLAVAEEDQCPMWLRHRQKKWLGVQFHPESFLTEKPELHLQIVKDWLNA
ncbi:aminodeoxychorismate/anthranilate synthase component II [Pseudobdellovibrio exovorus]|uniref:Glutamine amidotransferase domain-containing protein n=1 Tax=Pseudobdellovibrio exovorus JSS TaxID=1184267 RepID=M4VT53_9BACT|nr:aminodeoxychorismate/anthranilate synthase component II [Pseudobdellovibrio exovorus]AGH96389.1 hypothetical protein A11Q_2173 [Pseudobdellovibrio exovorus JSS]